MHYVDPSAFSQTCTIVVAHFKHSLFPALYRSAVGYDKALLSVLCCNLVAFYANMQMKHLTLAITAE